MRHRLLFVPLLLAFLVAACGGEATPFGPEVKRASDDAPVVVTGRLVDYAAAPAGDVLILVNAWPSAVAPSDLAARSTLHPVAWARSAADGSFEIRITADETLTGFAAENNNAVNFELSFFSGEAYPNKGLGAFGFSLPLTEEGFTPAGALGDITVFP